MALELTTIDLGDEGFLDALHRIVMAANSAAESTDSWSHNPEDRQRRRDLMLAAATAEWDLVMSVGDKSRAAA